MNLILILIGFAAAFILGFCLSDARRPNDYDGLFITHEELGKMREEWIEYGKKLGRKENDNSPCKPRR